MKNFGILKEILLTEKSNLLLSEKQQYVFVVDAKASKYQIAEAVEMAFSVKVANVNVMNCQGKAKRVRSKVRNRCTIVGRKKKAIVCLRHGHRIDVA
ncbi:MAG: 50S ribosomal protein L23 [Puniceicoccales bacterium]|jgi:large subunit ribosomal protein L23|nr:50S ribosomal protein L23 [Puniceicoccales bacterium]